MSIQIYTKTTYVRNPLSFLRFDLLHSLDHTPFQRLIEAILLERQFDVARLLGGADTILAEHGQHLGHVNVMRLEGLGDVRALGHRQP